MNPEHSWKCFHVRQGIPDRSLWLSLTLPHRRTRTETGVSSTPGRLAARGSRGRPPRGARQARRGPGRRENGRGASCWRKFSLRHADRDHRVPDRHHLGGYTGGPHPRPGHRARDRRPQRGQGDAGRAPERCPPQSEISGCSPASRARPPQPRLPSGYPTTSAPMRTTPDSPVPAGSVTTVRVDAAGAGYTTPTVAILDAWGTGSGATATAGIDASMGVAGHRRNHYQGAGYTAPILVICDATGAGAAATPVLDADGRYSQVRRHLAQRAARRSPPTAWASSPHRRARKRHLPGRRL